jgi:hypothetical protein
MIVTDNRVVGEVGIFFAWYEGETLAYVPDEIRKCVVFLGYRDKNDIEHVAGSAFWIINVQKEEDIRQEYAPAYLVTAAHVLRDIKEKGISDAVLIRFNPPRGNAAWTSVNVDRWERHPDKNVDVAILKAPIEGDHGGWLTNFFVTQESCNEDHKEIDLGDEVFFPGLFWPHKGSRNIPIVRVGNVSALREENIETQFGLMDVYLVEARSIGGLSGSPVFIDILANRIAKEVQLNPPIIGPSRFRLIGLITGHFRGLDDQAGSTAVPPAEQERLNMGIAFVAPGEKILEALAIFVDEERKEREEYRAEKRSSMAFDGVPSSNVAVQVTSTRSQIPELAEQQFFDDLRKASRKNKGSVD